MRTGIEVREVGGERRERWEERGETRDEAKER
jgi:hypothetical protein